MISPHNVARVIHVSAYDVVVIAGPPASGKSTLRGSLPNVVSYDAARAHINGDAADASNPEEVSAHVDRLRKTILQTGKGYVCDAVNLNPDYRQRELAMARDYQRRAILVVAASRSVEDLLARNQSRGRVVPSDVIEAHAAAHGELTLSDLAAEGWDEIHVFDDRTRLVVGSHAQNVFDRVGIVSDPHGCAKTFIPAVEELLAEGRIPVIVGDLTDKGGVRATGPNGTGNPEDSGAVAVLRWNLQAAARGDVLAVSGNHCDKLKRFLRRLIDQVIGSGDDLFAQDTWTVALDRLLGPNPPKATPKAGFGLEQTLRDIVAQPDVATFVPAVLGFLDRLPTHLVLPTVVVTHGGISVSKLHADYRDTRSAMYERGDFRWDMPARQPDGTPGRKLVRGHEIQDDGYPTFRITPHPAGRRAEVISIDTGAYKARTVGGLTAYFPDLDVVENAPAVLPDGSKVNRLLPQAYRTWATHPDDLCPVDEAEDLAAQVRDLFDDQAA